MTEWTIATELARGIVISCFALMAIGVILILVSFRRTKARYGEQLEATNDMLRVYRENVFNLDNIAVAEISKEREGKREIPNRLEQIDDYLASYVENQDLDADTLRDLAPKIFRWYEWFTVLFVGVTYLFRITKRIFRGTHERFIIRFATKFSYVLNEYNLGTLPAVQADPQYLRLYRDLIHMELGLPSGIIVKIRRNILLSISINSMRIIKHDSPFWDALEDEEINHAMLRSLLIVRNSWTSLLVILDSVVVELRNEIERDIKNYIGVKQ